MNLIEYPFRHFVEDDFWDSDFLHRVEAEIPEASAPDWRRYDNHLEDKFEGGPSMWRSNTRLLLDKMASRGDELSELFNIPDLQMRTMGGGYHLIPPGGKLAVHADFNRSDDGLYRRLNMLVYLNDGWTEADGGHLELWDDQGCVERILPIFNRTVVFETSSTSFHGHPVPLPGPRSRRSVAAYFFSPQPGQDYLKDHSTVWK
jgi:Rps23 Pro-64 3,4-dihydroxylase Tpa1-like proline 4-hydroxylase